MRFILDLDRLNEAGFDVAPAEEMLTEMVRLVDSATANADEVPRLVLDLSASDYPGSTEVLRSAHDTLKEAGSQLRQAGETAHEIGRFIKSLFGGDED